MRRTSLVLRPDPRRVVARIFLPGQEITAAGRSRSAGVVKRVLDLSDAEVEETLSGLRDSFDTRHRDLSATWRANADLLGHRFVGQVPPSPARRLLLGAYFTQEYAIEAAALCNPSLVAHPDQRGVEVGATRLVMSVRAVGEGHISSIELRTGMVDAEDVVTFDPPPTTAVLPEPIPQTYSRDSFRRAFEQRGGHHEDADLVLGSLPETFTREDLDVGIAALREQRLTRGAGAVTIDRIERLAAGKLHGGVPHLLPHPGTGPDAAGTAGEPRHGGPPAGPQDRWRRLGPLPRHLHRVRRSYRHTRSCCGRWTSGGSTASSSADPVRGTRGWRSSPAAWAGSTWP